MIKSGPRSKAELSKNKKESGVFLGGLWSYTKGRYDEEGTAETNRPLAGKVKDVE